MREVLFQRLWQYQAFSTNDLRTTGGEKVHISNTGTLNKFDGPDFSDGIVHIASRLGHGAIELHIDCNDWYLHNHHLDPAYNTVVLHVCLHSREAGPVLREDGEYVPTVVLKPHLHPKWQTRLLELEKHRTLTCSGFLSNISDDVVDHQLRSAAKLYFEIKCDKMLEWYAPNRIPSDAFLRMFWINWCDGLGIPANREPMRHLAERSWDYVLPPPITLHQCADLLHSLAVKQDQSIVTADEYTNSKLSWKNKNGRPVNQRVKRIDEASKMLHFLKMEGFRWFVRRSVQECLFEFNQINFAGKERSTVLHLTVLLPALHILGNLLYKPQLCRDAEHIWLNGNIPVPQPIKSVFQKGGGNMSLFSTSTGTLPQHRYYCSSGKCEDCFIFKNIVRG